MLMKRSMRSKSCFALSSFLVLTACFATESLDGSDEDRKQGDRKEDLKEDAKPDESKPDDPPRDVYFVAPLTAPAGGDGDGDEALPDCPLEQGRMEDGSCAPAEEFFQEQESLDAEALAAMQSAVDPKQEVEAQEDLIYRQAAQMKQAEKDLDEIIREVKERKKSGKGFKGKKEEFGDL